MHIAFLVVKHILRGGGIEKYTYELGRRLAARGHRVTVYSMRNYGDLETDCAGMRVVPVGSLRHPYTEKLSASTIGTLTCLLARERPDIVHSHSVAAGLFGLTHRLRRTRTVLQMHGIEWQRSRWGFIGSSVLRGLEAIALRSHDAITAVSQTQCAFYKARHGIDMHYIPTGADVKPPTPAAKLLEMGLTPGRYVFFASRLVREKGAHYLLAAFRDLRSDWDLVLAGDAPGEATYKRELHLLAGSDARIRFLGHVEGRVLEELFSHAGVYVHPSELEGLSIALLEAMGYGNCCLVSDIPENREALGDTGRTFVSGDVASLRHALEQLMDDESERKRLGTLARNRVGAFYSWDGIADSFEQLYSSLLARPSYSA